MSVTDDFNRADAADLGANWTDIENGCSVASNVAKPDTATAYNASMWSANSFNDAHTSQVVRAVNADQYEGPAVRCAAGANYYTYLNHGEVQKSVAGSHSTIQSGLGTFNTVGDVAKIAVSGATLESFKNGVSQGTVTDSSLSGGAAGIAFYASQIPKLDDWVGTGEVVSSSVHDARFARPHLRAAPFKPGLAR